jgi:hypothetical protein
MHYVLLALLALACTCSNAHAWGDSGHKIVRVIAFRQAQRALHQISKKLKGLTSDECPTAGNLVTK